MTASPAVEQPGPALWSAAGGEPFLLMDSFRARRREGECTIPDWESVGPLLFAPALNEAPEKTAFDAPVSSVPSPEVRKRLGIGLLSSLAVHAAVFLVLICIGTAPAALAPEAGDGPEVFHVGLGGLGGSGGTGGKGAGLPGAGASATEPTAPEPIAVEPAPPDTAAPEPNRPESMPVPMPEVVAEPVSEPVPAAVEPEQIPIKPLTPPPPKPKPAEKKPERPVKRQEAAAKAPTPKPASPKPAAKAGHIDPAAGVTTGATSSGAGAGQTGPGGVSGSGGVGAGSGLGNGDPAGSGGGGGGEGYAKGNYKYIRKRILQHLVYPPQARRMGLQGTVTVSFLVDREGRAKDIRVTGSSGYESIDQSAVEAVENASPFPPPPEPARIVIPIGLKLK